MRAKVILVAHRQRNEPRTERLLALAAMRSLRTSRHHSASVPYKAADWARVVIADSGPTLGSGSIQMTNSIAGPDPEGEKQEPVEQIRTAQGADPAPRRRAGGREPATRAPDSRTSSSVPRSVAATSARASPRAKVGKADELRSDRTSTSKVTRPTASAGGSGHRCSDRMPSSQAAASARTRGRGG